MRKYAITFALIYCTYDCELKAQTDSSNFDINGLSEFSTVEINENDISPPMELNVPSLLRAQRNRFLNTASFNFSISRFKIRGYDYSYSNTFVNHLKIKDLESGYQAFGLWSGLNEMMRYSVQSADLNPLENGIPALSQSAEIDFRPGAMRKKTSFSYSATNRIYKHNARVVYNSGYSQNNWAVSFELNTRQANKGYVPGTYTKSFSYAAGIEKKDLHNRLSFQIIGAATENARYQASTLEAKQLARDTYYNPSWGYQNGKIRNANISKQHIPLLILTNEHRWHKTLWSNSLLFYTGNKSYTSLDWYNAPDPRPDYYRYLPSNYSEFDNRENLKNYYTQNPEKLQIQWDDLIEINRNQSFNNTPYLGKGRANYIVGSHNSHITNFSVNSHVDSKLNAQLKLQASMQYDRYQTHHFQKVEDLLGADYWLNINQFAERDFPSDPLATQFDINQPNRKIISGENYGYDYTIDIQNITQWIQLQFQGKKIDAFSNFQIEYNQIQRIGNQQTGLFPLNSKGKSEVYTFMKPSLSGGITYKIDGKNYLTLNALFLQNPLRTRTVFLSPRMQNSIRKDLASEQIYSGQISYTHMNEALDLKINGYFTQFKNSSETRNFYDDFSRSFINYTLSSIQKIHYGTEASVEYRITEPMAIHGVASIGNFYYSNSANATAIADNTAIWMTNERVFLKNYHLSNTPQSAYNVGIDYKTGHFVWLQLNANYLDHNWMAINPNRRTYKAIEDLNPAQTTSQIEAILSQTKLPSVFTLNAFVYYTKSLKAHKPSRKNHSISANISLNNLLNNRNIVSSAFEQNRFDFSEADASKFPPKYSYSLGFNFFSGVTYSF